jgi:hypothetical protein
VTQHLRALTRTERVRVLDAVARQLVHEPLVETRNRKPLRPNPIAPVGVARRVAAGVL